MRLPLQVRYPRPKCWQVNLEFGPHSFKLLEYETEEVARIAMSSIESNWKIFVEKRENQNERKRRYSLSIIVSIETDLGKVAHAFVVGASKTKAALIYAAQEVDAIKPEVLAVEEVANKMIAQVYPGADLVALAIEAGFGAVLDAVDALGAAAQANGLSVTLDAAAIAKVKAALPIIKAQAKTTPGS